MKNKKSYIIISKTNKSSKIIYGCFERNKRGLQRALEYKEKLEKDSKEKFSIK